MLIGQAEQSSDADEFLAVAQRCTGSSRIEVLSCEHTRIGVFSTDEGRRRYFVQSNDYVQVAGYNGITNLGIILDADGVVVSVRILDSEDTRSFVKRLKTSGYLKQFTGYGGSGEFETVTGATVTSQAVNETVQRTVAFVGQLIETL